jgi:hypothetical protein
MTISPSTARCIQCVQGGDFLRKSPLELGGLETLQKEKLL